MRSSKPRLRSKNNRNNNNRSAANVLNRVFDSSGPEGKVRGTPQQVIEKYQQLTRDSQLSGDRVAAENFQQHAEHYMRLQTDAQREIDLRRDQQDRENREKQVQRDQERGERIERLDGTGNDNHVPETPSVEDPGVAEQSAPISKVKDFSTSESVQTDENFVPKTDPVRKPRVRRRTVEVDINGS
jgi:hypothetical protein